MARQQGDPRYLLVRSGGGYCALPVGMVRQVVRDLGCYPVPGSRSHLLGLAQFAGEPLAVLDLYALISGGPPAAAHHATVILGRDDQGVRSVLGLAVDEALAVTSLGNQMPTIESDGLVAATADVEGETVQVLDPHLLFGDEWRIGLGGSDA
jgi:chemotaxis signal transduction protein